MKAWTFPPVFALLLLVLSPLAAGAQDESGSPPGGDAAVTEPAAPPAALSQDPLDASGGGLPVNFLWTIVAAVLVFFMQAGFALVEAGLTRAKNVVNILAKNLSDALIGVVAFLAVGFAFAFGGDGWFLGTETFFLSGESLTDIAGGGANGTLTTLLAARPTRA